MRVLHFVPRLDAVVGGPSRSVPYQCVAALSDEISVTLAYINNDLELAPEAKDAAVRGVNTHAITPLDLFSRLPILIQSHDILHIHGVWSPSCYWASRLALRLGHRLVISPHGMLEPWPLAHKKWRKRTAMWLYQRGLLESADIVQATAYSEATSLRNLGLTCPIAVIPHGVAIPAYSASMAGKSRPRRILFLSRIHPKKGLLHLVRAVARHKEIIDTDHWRIIVAGADFDGHRVTVESEMVKLGVREFFEFVGNVDGQDKWDLYRTASLFVLPTFSENFGLVIAEALACGVPVVTTHGAPWSELETHRCGWWHPIDQEHLNDALQQALTTPPEVLQLMGQRGIALVRERYNMYEHGPDFRSMYNWISNGGSAPGCVV